MGVGKQEITCFLPGVGMMGYGQHHNIVKEVATPLWARALFIKGQEKNFILVHLEQAFVTIAIKEEVLKRLSLSHPDWKIKDQNLAITAQHTHSAPGGYSHYPLYNFTIPGFQLRVFEKIVSGILSSIEEAFKKIQRTTAYWGEIDIHPDKEMAFNRSMKAHARNPDTDLKNEEEKHLAVDRTMEGLCFKNLEGELVAFLNWFGVHCTSISSFNQHIHHDNKGIAASLFEKNYPTSLAFFLQASAGDVSPNFIWDKKKKLMRGKFKDQYENAEFNGELQFRESEKISFSEKLLNQFDFHHLFLDMTKEVGSPAHGVAFFKGTLEGPGVSPFLGGLLSKVSQSVREHHLKKNPSFHQDFYEAQGAKDVLLDHRTGSFLGIPLSVWKYLPPLPEPTLEALRKTAKNEAIKTLPWVPPILPFQVLRLGQVLIAFVPGEITTVAGRRLRSYLLNELGDQGIEKVIMSSYANAFMGYITTPEEYDEQCYEGGHTVYGRNTLGGILIGFSYLAKKIKGEKLSPNLPQQPFHYPPEELARRAVE